MPDMSEYHETEDEMEGRADSMRKAEKEGGRTVEIRDGQIVRDPILGRKFPEPLHALLTLGKKILGLS